MAEVVYSGAQDGFHEQGTLFNGMKFWLAQKVPQRSRFIKDVEANGGEVTRLEKQADIKIVDHARKEALPGIYSYTYIEASLRNQTLAKLDEHVVGPPEGTIRSVGSTTQPARSTRSRFTKEDDQMLWNWVQKNPQKGGGTDGNEIYKQLEAINSRHPWQSWRDRWVKHLKGTRPVFACSNAPPTPPSDQPEADGEQAPPHRPAGKEKQRNDFTEEDVKALLELGADIEAILPENIEAAWEKWVDDDDKIHSATEWRVFWEKTVRPIYLKRVENTEDLPTRSTANGQLQNGKAEEQRLNAQTQHSSPEKATGLTSTRSPFQRLKSSPIFARLGSRDHQLKLGTADEDVSSAAILRSDPSESQDEFYPSLEAQNDGQISPKRKHVDDKEFRSSSPPKKAPKRQRREKVSYEFEVPSTPEQSPKHLLVKSPSNAKHVAAPTIIDLIDDEGDEIELRSEESNEEEVFLGQQDSPVLSEPKLAASPTKVVIKEESPPIDYGIAPPEDGWGDAETESEPESEPESELESEPRPEPEPSGASDSQPRPVTQVPNSQNLDTQALFNAETQIPDFELPPLADEDGDNNNNDSSNEGDPSSPSQSEINILLDNWIENRVNAGHPLDTVEFALQCTSMDHELADEVLAYLKSKGTLPDDMPGVWTEVDDEDLEGPDGRRLKRLEAKHGSEALNMRWRFIEARRCAEAEG